MKILAPLVFMLLYFCSAAQRPSASRAVADTVFWPSNFITTLYYVPDPNNPLSPAGYLSGTDQILSAYGDSGSTTEQNVQIFQLGQQVNVTEAIYWFGAKSYISGDPNSKVVFKLYRLDGSFVNSLSNIVPGPGTLLATDTVPLSAIKAGYTPATGWNAIRFSTPVPVDGSFAIGFDIRNLNHKDTLGLFTSRLNQPLIKERSLIQFQNKPFRSFLDNTNGFSADVDLAIFPVVDSKLLCLSFYGFPHSTPSNCGTNGTASVAMYDGTPPYNYLWSTGDTGSAISKLKGNYSVTVSDINGCSAISTVKITSDCFSIISGNVFSDLDNDCVSNDANIKINQLTISATQNNNIFYGTTDKDGNYSIKVSNAGAYTLHLLQHGSDTCSKNTFCTNVDGIINITTLGDSSRSNNFALKITNDYDLTSHAGWNDANPGFQQDYWFYPYNASPVAYSDLATFTFKYDSNLVYFNSTPTAVNDPLNHTLTWTLNSVAGSMQDADQLHCSFTVPLALGLNYELVSQTSITGDGTSADCDLSNNNTDIRVVTRGSYDPNEKEVYPANDIFLEDSLLTYTIHFQNTGTDSTHFVVLKDTLSPELNPATVRNIASSHPYSDFTIEGPGILTWTFNPLRLVDSITNPEGSKGFVRFTVERTSNRSIGTVINNRASIYFDYNDPIMTNTVANTITERTGIAESIKAPLSVNLYPNPASTQLYISTTGFEPQRTAIYNINGQLLSVQKFASVQSISALPTGVYIVELRSETTVLRTKFVKMD